ncbi:MAG: RCC1 domain-containing protein [Planctomycetota bacterium]|nr:RCC1 domain-containing protein [Planctomycetota bacterium]
MVNPATRSQSEFRPNDWKVIVLAVLLISACGKDHDSKPRDVNSPTVTIDTPTTAATFFTASSPITVAGTASDNRTIASVEWSNAATSDTGTATGTTTWSASVALAPGDNSIRVTATDGAGNMGTASITITLDTAQPMVTIDTPTTSLAYDSPITPLTLGGTAWDDVGLIAVYWSNAATGGTGITSGTTTWSASVDLIVGTNPITVWTNDMVGNTATDAIVVTLCLGTALAWGENGSGQLGDGTVTDSSMPVAATGLTGVLEVAAGNLHAVALLCDGTVWEWGSGSSPPARSSPSLGGRWM